MSKKLINRLAFFLLCSTLLFHSTSESSDKAYNLKIQNWIEDIPILPSLIDNKKDVIEFDSSSGKLDISGTFEKNENWGEIGIQGTATVHDCTKK